jgi:hypothetical protein
MDGMDFVVLLVGGFVGYYFARHYMISGKAA